MSGWRCRGVRWVAGPRAVWGWGGGATSALDHGRELGFRVVGERLCPGARGNACPLRAVVGGRSTAGVCGECARLDRSRSVAADTLSDDPRVYRVYLAWFGPGLVKVGITAEERGDARLLEQGAVAFTWLGRGALMAARRTEGVLGAALGVPDRIPYRVKRLARVALPAVDERRAEVARLYGEAVGVTGWADTVERLELDVRDHGEVFGLQRLGHVDGVVGELAAGGVLRGTLLGVAGPDLHLLLPEGRHVVLDSRLAAGWELAAPGDSGVSVPVVAVPPAEPQGGLF
ncbi:DUF2797 domain-containing protein [Streptomyces sp. TRM64462]|uniref:DUF2797 domain-containing protein n=1 Tax=Streptomyces sp. TRM64462 TaxID=2741726 RepID=UPI001586398A|nr:DUF2797 domain-containing protein [Streptomyces sp. TRM64462]